MRKLSCTTLLAVLILVPVAAESGQGGNCSPEGTWYGYNTEGSIWLVTVSRSGPQSFTTVLDSGANAVEPPVAGSSDWRGELVKTGPTTYDWTTMAQLRGVEGFPFPFAVGYCPLWSVEFTDCDAWQGENLLGCTYLGYFPGQDPFEEGVPIQTGDPGTLVYLTRMPMSVP